MRWASALYALVALFAFGYALFSGHLGVFLGERAPTLAGVLGAFCVGLVILALVHLGLRVYLGRPRGGVCRGIEPAPHHSLGAEKLPAEDVRDEGGHR